MLPKELAEIYDDDYIFIQELHMAGNDLIIELITEIQDFAMQERRTQKWRITAVKAEENNLSLGYVDLIKLCNDHPILWAYNDMQCTLYFGGSCTNYYKLFYELYQIHRKLFGRYAHSGRPFSTLSVPFQFSNGMLDTGPKKLMLEYADCLKQNGMTSSIVPGYEPTYWNGFERVKYENQSALLFGESYVIAEDFVFTPSDPIRISLPHAGAA